MKDNKNNFKFCDVCKSKATLFCMECLCNYFCDSCYKLFHDKKENCNHKKEKIDYYAPIDIRCPEHKNVPLNLFCLDEKGKISIFYNLIIYYRIMLFNVCLFK